MLHRKRSICTGSFAGDSSNHAGTKAQSELRNHQLLNSIRENTLSNGFSPIVDLRLTNTSTRFTAIFLDLIFLSDLHRQKPLTVFSESILRSPFDRDAGRTACSSVRNSSRPWVASFVLRINGDFLIR